MLVATLFSMTAQGVSVGVPDAGFIMKQMELPKTIVPTEKPQGLILKHADETKSSGAKKASLDDVPFLVTSIQITGNTLFDTTVLHALVADAENKSKSFVEWKAVVARITHFYQDHGYVLVRVIIPPQAVVSGVLHVKVLEASYGKILLDNSSRVDDSLLRATLAPLKSQAIIGLDVNHVMLLISDIPGVLYSSTLRAGEATGTSDLLVDVTPGSAVNGNATIDNYGNFFTGVNRFSGGVNFINPLRHGDVLSVSALSSGEGMSYGQLSYESLLNGRGTRVGGSYSGLDYVLGKTLSALDMHGNAQTAKLWATHPFLRSTNLDIHGQVQVAHVQLQDRIDTSGIKTDRHLDTITLSTTGNRLDEFLTGGKNIWSMDWVAGHVAFDNVAAEAADASTTRKMGGFSKWNMSVARLQGLGIKNELYFVINGQWTDRNLDPSQRMFVGGPGTVRAYNMGATAGDTGYTASAEFRRTLGDQWQAVGFVDNAHTMVNKSTWVAGTNSVNMSGAGMELNWVGRNNFNAKVTVATTLGGRPDLVSASASTLVWVAASKGF
jgi:hemolysin activation/secretion protein